MRDLFVSALAFVAAFSLIGSAKAQNAGDTKPLPPPETRIAVDKEHNIISIVIDGKEIGRFDKDGLHVIGNIDYSGAVTDTNAAALDRPAATPGVRRAH